MIMDEETPNSILILFRKENNLLVVKSEELMAGKKGVIPSNVKSKKFFHPGIEQSFIQSLMSIEDPRKPSLFLRHSLPSILFMTLVAFICGATDWPKVVVMSQGMTDWLSKYVDMSSGVPCERTFKNLFNVLNPQLMESVLRDVAAQIRQIIPQEIISFDGQTERGTADRHATKNGIHLVHAWSAENKICLGQLKVDDKSNEITALPELMESLDLKGTIITNDALNTQKTIAKKAISLGADYVMPVKENHPGLLEEIFLLFQEKERELQIEQDQWNRALTKARESRDKNREKDLLAKGYPTGDFFYLEEDLEKGHGRIEKRSYTVVTAKSLPCKNEWEKIKALVRVRRERRKGDKIENAEVYYITSLDPSNEKIPEAIRNHWGVEQLHWQLDVTFKQDKSRYRDRVGARNMAVIRKLALTALSKETSKKAGMATKQCAAACDPSYRTKIIESLALALS